jgi:hypothetical protein
MKPFVERERGRDRQRDRETERDECRLAVRQVSLLVFVPGKQRRLQFVECANDINAMIDAAKFADLVLLLTDGSFGFEMVSLHNTHY